MYDKFTNETDFELLAPLNANVICFRYKPEGINDGESLNVLNEKLMHKLNSSGKIFLTHTKLNGKFTLRLVIAQTNVEERHTNKAFELIKEFSKQIKPS